MGGGDHEENGEDPPPKKTALRGRHGAATVAGTAAMRGRRPAERPARRPEKNGLFRIPFTHTILIVSILAIAAMVGGGVILYLRAVRALELGVEELSAKETDEIARKMQQFFEDPILAHEGVASYLYHTNDSGVQGQTVENIMFNTVKYVALSHIESSHILSEVGVVLLPKLILHPNGTRSTDQENIVYSHVWYDIEKDLSRQYVHAYYIPGVNRYDAENKKPKVRVAKINRTTGAENGETGQDFTPSGYYENTLNFLKFPTEPESDTIINSSCSIRTDLDNPDTTEHVINQEWREPTMWTSENNNTYSFSAHDSILLPPTDPDHPFHPYGAVQISTYFIYIAWNEVLRRAEGDSTLVFIYDRHHRYIYSPSNLTNTAESEECRSGLNGELVSHSFSLMKLCSGSVDDAGLLVKDLVDADEGIDKFEEVDVGGESYYVSYKAVYRSYTTKYGRNADSNYNNKSSVDQDIAIVWARRSAVVRAEITEVITIFVVFVVGVFTMFVILFTAQLGIIGKPMKALVIATEAMANLDTKTAQKALAGATNECTLVRVTEVESLMRSFKRTLRFMTEYKAFIPQGLDADDDQSEAESAPNAPARGAGVAPLALDKRDVVTLARLQQVGLKSKTGSVIEVRFDMRDLKVDDDNKKVMQFVSIVLTAVKKHSGIMLQTSPAVCVATWNTHNSCSRHAHAACFCALEIKRKTFAAGFKTANAVATGRLMAGSVGDQHTRAVAASGGALDIVHLVSYLCNYLGVPVLISEDTYDRVRASIEARVVDKVILDGVDSKVTLVYELRGELKSPAIDVPGDEKGLYNKGWMHFTQGRFREACAVLEQVVSGDRQVSRLLNLAHLFEKRNGKEPYVRRSRSPWEDFEQQLPWHDDPPMAPSDGASRQTDDDGQELVHLINNTLQKDGEEGSRMGLSFSGFTPSQSNTAFMSDMNADPYSSGMMNTSAHSVVYHGDAIPHELTTTKKETVYSSGKVLGEGSYGKVYVGMTPDGELIALKVLRLPEVHIMHEIINEVSLLSKVRHEHIVAYHGSAVTSENIVICMEYMPGGSLAQLLQHFGSFNASTVTRYTKDMLKGLDFLHTNQILHRDLKPGNVLVCSDGTCKLADFGTCSSLVGAGAAGGNQNKMVPMVGTPLYMSPEVVRGEHGFKSDIWSFGVTMAELLTGCVPYDINEGCLTPVAFVYLIGLKSLRPTIPEGIDALASAVLAKSLAEDPKDRAGCSELLSMQYFMT